MSQGFNEVISKPIERNAGKHAEVQNIVI